MVHFHPKTVPGMLKVGKSGEKKLIKSGKTRLERYFVERVWGEGGELVEELILWIPPFPRPPPFPPPAIMKPLHMFHLIDIFKQYVNRGKIWKLMNFRFSVSTCDRA